MYNLLLDLLYTLISSLSFIIIASKITDRKINEGSLFIVISTIGNLITLKTNMEFLLLPIETITLFYFCYITLKSISHTIFAVVLTDLIIVVSDAVAGLLLAVFFHIDFNTLSKHSAEFFAVFTVVVLIAFFISVFVNNIITKIDIEKEDIEKGVKSNMPLIIYSAFALVTIYGYIFVYKRFIKELNYFFVVFNASIIASHFIAVIILAYVNYKNIRNKLSQEYKDKELQQLKEYTNILEAVSDDLRSFKHDYANVMKVLESYIAVKDMKGLREFYTKELKPENERILNKNRSVYLLKNIKIDSLKGLLSSKIHYANSKGIDIRVEVLEEITEISIGELDICRIIGILMDNAIEAAELCEDKFIHLAIIKKDNYIIFVINNSCPQDTPAIDKICKDGFSTKGVGKGIGLRNVRNIIEGKYGNISFLTEAKDGVFKQELTIKEAEETTTV